MNDLESQSLEMMSSNEKESEQAAIKRLAALPPIDYDRARKQEAEKLGISVSALDKAVNAAKRNEIDDSGFPNVEPWEYPVNPGELLSDISATVHRFIVCNKETADAVALWASMTWFIDVIQVAPLAIITAPEKRCGKTQLLTILGKLSYRPLSASSISPASLYRAIEAWQPTLLLDETDAFMKENEELRGVINSGHSRDNAYVIRTVGDDHTPKRFSTWGAKALSGIGHLSDTLMDRAIILELRRKLVHETVDRLRYAEPDLFLTLTSKLARFADDYREQVRRARPMLPDALNDRAQDNWEPLLAIAGCAGSEWLDRANQVALKLSAGDKSASISNELLADIQEVFESKRANKISTADLINTLIEDTEKSWATYNRGKPLSPKQLANKLRDYGIQSKLVRNGYDVYRGFELAQFEESFSRYLTPVLSVTTLQPNNSNGLHVTNEKCVTVTNSLSVTNQCNDVTACNVTENDPVTLKPAPDKDCNTVTHRTPPAKKIVRI
jgi:putative DNA primase/helicase